jgi:tetratricopeptide (TPR) repeat protein
MGYGGNDASIHKLLRSLPRAALPQGIYWVNKDPPAGPIRAWLLERGAVWVKGGYFDEGMLLVRNAFDLPHPDPGRFTRIFEGYHKTFQDLSSAIEKKPAEALDTLKLKEAVKKAEESFPDDWQVMSAADRLHESAPEEADQIYRRGIEQFPTSAPLLGNYALFLSNVRKDAEKAEAFYQRAIEADPKNANNIGNYAGMLLAIGRQTEGLSMLDRALDAADAQLMTRVECWFYALAHGASEQRGEALAQLKQLIAREGARSPGWNLSGNVERARSDGHPDVAWLALLADVISKNADPAVLQAWPAWAAA